MKKTYAAPVIKVTSIESECLICLSAKGTAGDGTTGLVRQRGSRSSFILDDFDE